MWQEAGSPAAPLTIDSGSGEAAVFNERGMEPCMISVSSHCVRLDCLAHAGANL